MAQDRMRSKHVLGAAADLLAAIDRIARDPSFAINPSKTMPHADILRALKTAERASKETRTPRNDAYSDLVQKLWQSEEE